MVLLVFDFVQGHPVSNSEIAGGDNACDKSEQTAETSLFMALSRLSSMQASSVLVGNPLTSIAIFDRLGELLSPSEPTEEAGDRCLGSGLGRRSRSPCHVESGLVHPYQ